MGDGRALILLSVCNLGSCAYRTQQWRAPLSLHETLACDLSPHRIQKLISKRDALLAMSCIRYKASLLTHLDHPPRAISTEAPKHTNPSLSYHPRAFIHMWYPSLVFRSNIHTTRCHLHVKLMIVSRVLRLVDAASAMHPPRPNLPPAHLQRV